MSASHDVVVIGGGVNSLVAAACLAKAGRKVLLLERRDGIGGQSRTDEFHPGFHADPLGQDAGWLPPAVARELGLTGVARVVPDPSLVVPAGPGEWLTLPRDPGRAADQIRRYSTRDAAAWPAFTTLVARLAGVLEALYVLPAPDIDTTSLGELLPLLGVAKKLRGLGRRDMVEFLRTVPMSVQELLDDRFECGPLKAAVGAIGVTNIRQGPRSGGTAFVLLHHQVGAEPGAMHGRGYWQAGPDGLTRVLTAVAQRYGVTLRTGAKVVRVTVKDDGVSGVVLESGEEIATGTVLSGADPARTLLGMVDPVWLDPEFLLAVRNIKFRGNGARVLYALDGLPEFPGLAGSPGALAGTLTLSSALDDIERSADDAKYGRVSERPHVEVQLPSVRWSGMAPDGKHVAVAQASSAPYRPRAGAWAPATRDDLGNRVTAAIARVAPGFPDLVRNCEVLTPADIEERYGLTEGAPTQGEMTLDQILFMRPVAGASRYATPVSGLYLCGAGTHPGSGIAGGPGWLAARRVIRDRGERRGANS
ncbi:MAG TPA: NAD(P)/FAD-dependent oxidoreductase [Gemmatimonadales bacterium]|nr:NAD(P)/FAD-dependent oxidoreductase [Gemmatimonadales bacterium]